MSSRTYVVYADESNTHDRELAHSQFYGGCLVRAEHRDRLVASLEARAAALGILGEIKWRKVRPFNAARVQDVIDLFFDMVEDGLVKLRVMWLPQGLSRVPADTYYLEHGYYILYYFFVIAGFGLSHHDEDGEVVIEFFPDTLPDEPEKKARFVSFLMNAHQTARYRGRSRFRVIRVGDVDSRKHVLLQCSDVVIGALGYLMNGHDSARQKDGTFAEGTRVRGDFARRVVDRIQRIHHQQCGSSYALTASTGPGKDGQGSALRVNHWRFAYRQWSFTSK